MESDLNLATPSGIRDWPVGLAPIKRIVENKLADLFNCWGYDEVITGTIEFEELAARSLNEEEKSQLYRFFGRDGEALTLRPDMTTPIARYVASQKLDCKKPLRLFYTGNVFRHEKPQAGRYREFYQAGIELIGADSGRADAEVIIMATEALSTLGLEKFKLGIGQVWLLDALLENSSLGEAGRRRLKKAIASKDYVTVNGIIEDGNVSPRERELLVSMPFVQSPDEFFERLEGFEFPRQIIVQISRFKEVFAALMGAGLEKNVFVDLGITRDFEYYTGMVFEAYTHGLGFPICGGGRYNNLYSRFGLDCPATGFALGIERILMVLENAGKLPATDTRKYLVCGTDFQKVLSKAAELRAQNYVAKVDVEGKGIEELEQEAAAAGLELYEVKAGEG